MLEAIATAWANIWQFIRGLWPVRAILGLFQGGKSRLARPKRRRRTGEWSLFWGLAKAKWADDDQFWPPDDAPPEKPDSKLLS